MQKRMKAVFDCRDLTTHILEYVPTPMRCRAARTNKVFSSIAKKPDHFVADVERLRPSRPFELINLTARDWLWHEFGDYCYSCGDWSRRAQLKVPVPEWLWIPETTADGRDVRQYHLTELDLCALFYGHGICDDCHPGYIVNRVRDKAQIPPWAHHPLNKRYLELFDCWLYSTTPRSKSTSIVAHKPRNEDIVWRDSAGLIVRTCKMSSAFDRFCVMLTRWRFQAEPIMGTSTSMVLVGTLLGLWAAYWLIRLIRLVARLAEEADP
jgi:hypothetical protein